MPRPQQDSKDGVLIFLDFDGVTHPECSRPEQLFTCLYLIEDVLRAHPCVDVVISSSWRIARPLEQLRQHFSHDIAPRVIGCTPISTRHKAELAELHLRELEIRSWLQTHAPKRPWVAIDDVPWLFSVGCPNLFLTNTRTGFTPSNARRLHERLSR